MHDQAKQAGRHAMSMKAWEKAGKEGSSENGENSEQKGRTTHVWAGKENWKEEGTAFTKLARLAAL